MQDLGSRQYRVIVDRRGGLFRLCSSRDGNRSHSGDEVKDVDELHFLGIESVRYDIEDSV